MRLDEYSTTLKVLDIIWCKGLVLISMVYIWSLWNAQLAFYHKLPLCIIAMGCGQVMADFNSGLIHWFGDRYGDPKWPVLGRYLIFGFREHHIYPRKMTEHSFYRINGTPCLFGMVPVGFAWIFLPPIGSSDFWFFVTATLLWTGFISSSTNQFHVWAHREKVPGWVRKAQKWRLIISPEHHHVHHHSPFDTYYCITCGWLNGLFSKIHFWSNLEKLIFCVTKVKAGDYDLLDYKQPPEV